MLIRRDSYVGMALSSWTGPFTVVVGVIVLIAALRRISPKFNDLFVFFVFVPFYMLTIKIDTLLGRLNILQRFPRNRDDVLRAPRRFFDLVKTNDLALLQKQARCRSTFTPHLAGALLDAERLVPKDAVMTTFEPLDGISTEPLKNKQLGLFRVGFNLPPPKSAGSGEAGSAEAASDKKTDAKKNDDAENDRLILTERQTVWFVKFSSERQVSTFLRALGSAFLTVPNEVSFYRNVAPLLTTLRIPKAVAAFSSRPFARLCVVMQYIPEPWRPMTDAVGATPGQVRALATAQASLHARFWRPAADHPALHFIRPASRVGLGWLDLVRMYVARGSPWMARLWAAMQPYFRDAYMSLSHGDCRPGNCLFARTSELRRDRAPAAADDDHWEVTLTDWEAVSITPFLWDHTYLTTIGQKTEARRALYGAQLADYLAALFDRNRSVEADLGTRYGRDLLAYLAVTRTLLVICIFYFGVLLECVGGVGEVQGNTTGDMNAWNERIGNAILDLVDSAKLAQSLAAAGGAAANEAQIRADLDELRQSATKMVSNGYYGGKQ